MRPRGTHGPTRRSLEREARRTGVDFLDQVIGTEPHEQARATHKYISEDYKLRHQIPINIYDAARSYRDVSDQQGTGLRAILKQADFRDAWRTFRGTGIKGGTATYFREKLAAGKVLGWDTQQEVIERLRNLSP